MKLHFQIFCLIVGLSLSCYLLATDSVMLTEFKQAQSIYLEFSESDKWAEALPYAKKSYQLGLKLFGDEHKNTAALADNYALNLIRLDKDEEAKKILLETLKINESIYGKESIELTPILMDLGHISTSVNHKLGKMEFYKRALNIIETEHGVDSISYGETLVEVGFNLMYIAKKINLGKSYLYDGHKILSKQLKETDPRLGYAAFNIAKYEFAKKRFDSAISYFNQTLQSYEQPDRPSNKVELITHSLLVEAYERVNKSDEATRHCLAIGRMTPFTDNQEYIPLVKIAPDYPRAAANAGRGGYVTIEYDVDEAGFVINPRVDELQGHKSFIDSGMEAAKKFRYAPRFKDGKPVVTKGVKNRFKYEIQN